MSSIIRTCAWVCIFSIAMAALEASVVVYLRALYYPEGFTVAFKIIDEAIIKVELLRELATLIMLLSVGYLTGHNFKDRLAYFLLSFAIWDIFYYAWLKMLIDWPSSIMEFKADDKTWTVVLAPPSRMQSRGLEESMLSKGVKATVVGYPHVKIEDEMRAERITIGDKTTELR